MQNRSHSESRGFRTVESWAKSSDPKVGWTHSSTSQSGILTYGEEFSVVNGTGGTPGRRNATNYSFSKTKRIYGSGSITSGDLDTAYTVTTGASFGTAMSPNGSAASVDMSMNNVYNEALGKLSEQVRGNLDLAIDLLEYKQTGAMLSNFKIPRLYNYVRSFHPKRWSSKWLEFQYGWKPLVSSIYEVSQKLCTPPREGAVRFKVRQAERGTRVRENGSGYLRDTTTTNFSKRVELVVCLDMKPSFWQEASSISSLNPASIAWELCPYSFVADWLIDIGGYLRNLENAFLYNMAFKNGYVTYGTYRKDESVKAGSVETGPNSQTIYTGCVHQVIRTSKQRSALGTYPLPMFPHPKLDLGSYRALSAGALLNEFFKKAR